MSASFVVAGAGLVLSSSAPGLPVQDVLDRPGSPVGEVGDQPSDFGEAEVDELGRSVSAFPVSSSRARRTVRQVWEAMARVMWRCQPGAGLRSSPVAGTPRWADRGNAGVRPESVRRWKRQWEQGGAPALRRSPATGRPPKLDDAQVEKVRAALEQGAPVRGQSVPHQYHRLAGVEPSDLLQNLDQRGGVVAARLEVEAQSRTALSVGGVVSQRGGHRGAFPVQPVPERGGTAAGRVGPTHLWEQRHARLVGEHDPGTFLHRPLLMRGHSWVTHRAISDSSRSTARRWGRCRVHPSRPVSSRHTDARQL